MQDTGLSMNRALQVRLRLQVLPREGEPFEAQLLTFLPPLDLSKFQPGTLAQVRIDPQRPGTVGLVGPIGSVEPYAPEGGPLPALTPLLHRLVEANERATSLGEAPERAAEVLALRPLGLRVAGSHPLCAVDLRVEGDPAPRSTVGVISALTLERYAPGRSVWVRVDPSDPARVVLSRSG